MLGLRKTLSRECTGKQKELLLIRLLSVIKSTFASCPEFELELYEKINQAWSCWRPVTSPKMVPSWILPRRRNQVKTAINTIFLCLTCKITIISTLHFPSKNGLNNCSLSYLSEHSDVSQARTLHACWTRMLSHDRLETIENSQSTNSAKTLKIFNVYSSLGL